MAKKYRVQEIKNKLGRKKSDILDLFPRQKVSNQYLFLIGTKSNPTLSVEEAIKLGSDIVAGRLITNEGEEQMRRTLSDKVNTAFDTGMNIAEIAKHFGYGQNTVRNMLTPERIAELRGRRIKQSVVNDRDVANILGQYQMCKEVDAIAKSMNLKIESVQREIDNASRTYNPEKPPVKPEINFDWRLKVPSLDLLTFDEKQKAIGYMRTKFQII